jgi:hypothetical protein
MADRDEVKEKVFIVHTTGGEELRIRAAEYGINPNTNRVFFTDTQRKHLDEWIVFLNAGRGYSSNRRGYMGC